MIHEDRIKKMIAMFSLMHGTARQRDKDGDPIEFATPETKRWVNTVCDVLCWVMDYPNNFGEYEKNTMDRINATPAAKAQLEGIMSGWDETVATANEEYAKLEKKHGGDLSKLSKEQLMEIARRMYETGEKDVIAHGHEFSRAGGVGQKDAEMVICGDAPTDGDLSKYEPGTIVTQCNHCKKDILLAPSSPQNLPNVCLNCVQQASKGEQAINE